MKQKNIYFIHTQHIFYPQNNFNLFLLLPTIIINLIIYLIYLFTYLFIFYLFMYLLILYLFQWQQNIKHLLFHFLFKSLCTCIHNVFINHYTSFLISFFHPSIEGEFKTLRSRGMVYPYLSIVWVSRLR